MENSGVISPRPCVLAGGRAQTAAGTPFLAPCGNYIRELHAVRRRSSPSGHGRDYHLQGETRLRFESMRLLTTLTQIY